VSCPAAAGEAVEEGRIETRERRPNLKSVGPRRLKYPIVWIDLEMTGLDPDLDAILEIAVVVTDGDLQRVFRGPNIVVHHSEAVLGSMNEWCSTHHGASGLTSASRESRHDTAAAEEEVMGWLGGLLPEAGVAPLAGNSVHVDRAFLLRHMPRVAAHCKHRIIDVSSLAECAMRWCARKIHGRPRKALRHTAMADVLESIDELRFYQRAIFGRRLSEGTVSEEQWP